VRPAPERLRQKTSPHREVLGARSFATENVSTHRVYQEELLCRFPSTISISFRGIGIPIAHVFRSLSRLACRCSWATPTSALSKRRGVICAVAGHGHEFSLGLFAFDERPSCLGLGFGEEIFYPRLPGDGKAASAGLSPESSSCECPWPVII